MSDGLFQLVSSPILLDELERALEYPKVNKYFVWRQQEKEEALQLMRNTASMASPAPVFIANLTDLSDSKFVQVAIAGAADYVVTGDSALLRLEEYEGIAIVTARRFLTILEVEMP